MLPRLQGGAPNQCVQSGSLLWKVPTLRGKDKSLGVVFPGGVLWQGDIWGEGPPFPGEPLGRGEVGRRKSRSPNLESGFGEEGAAPGAS